MVQGGVDLAVGSVDRVEVTRSSRVVWLTDQVGEWTEPPHAELDQQDAELLPDGCQAVASAFADPLDDAFGAELAEVVARLAESVLIADQVMAGSDARVQLAMVDTEGSGHRSSVEGDRCPAVGVRR